MKYPGNPSLEPEIRERVLETFRQTISLAEQGNAPEADLGCDFILRLDPTFEPARILKSRIDRAGDGPVDVDDIRTSLSEALESEEDEEVTPEDLAPASPPGEDSGGKAADDDGLRQSIRDAVENRDFGRALQLIEANRSKLVGDAEVRGLADTARSRLEAEPYVKEFLQRAREAAREGQDQAAAEFIDKARSLDDSHPEIAELEKVRGFYTDPEYKMGYRRDVDSGGSDQPAAAASAEATDASAPESAQRIAELLAEGQANFDDRDYQAAIDSWSRIYLIDIDHAEATRRIEEARRLKAESEREVEEIYHDAARHLDVGETDAARRGFERVLEIAPEHFAARDQLARLDAPASAPPGPGLEAPEPPMPPEAEAAETDLYQPEAPPARPAAPKRARGATRPAEPAAAAPPRGLRKFVWIGSVVLVLALAGAWWLYTQRSEFFPNAQEPVAEAQRSPIDRARAQHAAGRVPQAIETLRGVPPNDPDYSQAQALIAQWQTSPDESEGPSEEDLAGREELLSEARAAYEGGDYLTASEQLDRAAAIAPLAGDSAQLRGAVDEVLAPVAAQLELFRTSDWDFALPELWRMREEDPGNRIVTRMLVNGYYNLAVRDLQRSNPRGAEEKLLEAAQLAPGDQDVQRLLAFARTYTDRQPDLQYRLFVKYLPFR